MLEQVEWGGFRLGDLFESSNGDFDIQKSHINGKGEYVITAGLTDNGILGKTDIPARIFDAGTITIDMFGCAFYRQFKYKIVTHARVFSLKPKFTLSICEGLFLANSFHFLSKEFGYENMCSWAKIENKKIQLPIKNGEIDFEFMDNFIAELEKNHLKEEEYRSERKINAYLQVTGLKNYELTNDELKVLKEFEDGKMDWKEFKVENLFDILPIHQKLSKKNLEKNGTVPIYSSDSSNNGIIGYCNQQPTYLINETITFYNIFGDHTKTMNIAKESFCIMDNVKVLKPKGQSIRQILFVNTVRRKQIPDLGYARHRSKAREVNIPLPIKNNEIDYDLMETFISAIHKLVIKDLVLYNQERLKATAQVINKNL